MSSDLTSDLLSGPYGFLVAIAGLLWLASREFRRGRQIDVSTYQGDLAELTERLKVRDEAHRLEVAALQDDLQDVKTDLAALRDENTTQARAAGIRIERLIRENAGLRALLAEAQIDTASVERD